MTTGITRRKDGRLMHQFVIDGKRHTVYGRTVKECREKELEKREKIAAGKSEKVETLDRYFEQWYLAKIGTVRESTLRSNNMMYRNIGSREISGKTFGQYALDEIEPKHIKELQSMLIHAGKSTRTTNDTISMLTGILESATNERIILWNPAKAIKALRRTESQASETIHRALTKEETDRFMTTAQNTWYYNLFVFLLYTGCREGEAGAISAFDIRNGGVHISKTITRTETGVYVVGDDTKTAAGRRFIPLRDIALQAIRRQQDVNKVMNYPETPIFRTPRGTLLKASVVNTAIANICKKCGVDRFGVHAFRDTFATRCVESGMEVKQLQSIMGHTDVAMTLGLYAHADDERKVEQLKAVDF